MAGCCANTHTRSARSCRQSAAGGGRRGRCSASASRRWGAEPRGTGSLPGGGGGGGSRRGGERGVSGWQRAGLVGPRQACSARAWPQPSWLLSNSTSRYTTQPTPTPTTTTTSATPRPHTCVATRGGVVGPAVVGVERVKARGGAVGGLRQAGRLHKRLAGLVVASGGLQGCGGQGGGDGWVGQPINK